MVGFMVDNIKNTAITTFISLVFSLIIGEFIFDLIDADDCDRNLPGLFGRFFIGVVFAILTPIFYGFPPQNKGGIGEPFNS